MKPKHLPCDLQEWLDTATYKLSPSAKERVRLEIEAHFSETVAAHQGNGASEIGARFMALEDLGDARKANRQFQRRYLSDWEAKHVGSLLLNQRQMKQVLLFSHLLFAVWAVGGIWKIWDWRGSPSFRSDCVVEAIKLAVASLVFVVVPIAQFRLSKKPASTKKTRTLLLLNSFGGVYAGFILLPLLSFSASSPLHVVSLGLAACCLISNLWLSLRVLKKLRLA